MNYYLLLKVMLLLNLHLLHAAPLQSNDIDHSDNISGVGGGAMGNILRAYNNSQNSQMDYNLLFGHMKDFFLYLPVMMNSLRESMSGFPKFAEGVRILTSKSGHSESGGCSCEKNNNEIDSRQVADSSERRRDLWR